MEFVWSMHLDGMSCVNNVDDIRISCTISKNRLTARVKVLKIVGPIGEGQTELDFAVGRFETLDDAIKWCEETAISMRLKH